MNLRSFTGLMAMEAFYTDYLNCHMWHTTEYGDPYEPKDRERFAHEYHDLLSMVIHCMNEEGNWSPPFTDAITDHTRGLDLKAVLRVQRPAQNVAKLPALAPPTLKGN